MDEKLQPAPEEGPTADMTGPEAVRRGLPDEQIRYHFRKDHENEASPLPELTPKDQAAALERLRRLSSGDYSEPDQPEPPQAT